ncbi:MAG: peroxiredoxin [Clostridia bacterium]|nr:peroxiredoxin [Clostridia bacterium]
MNENCLNNAIHIGDEAPLFNANTTHGPLKLSDYAGRWVILFSHPGDFTPVCTTEFIAFSKMEPEFKTRNCALMGLSIDSTPSHLAWIKSIYNMTGIKVPFPIISDLDMSISRKYGMLAPDVSTTQTIRSVFFIDPNGKIRAILQYPMTNGRNIGEILRLLDAMQLSDKNKVSTPANWIPGSPTIVTSPKTSDEVFNNTANQNCIDWYLCYNDSISSIGIDKNLF